jgi:hypothetical protein
VVHRPLPSEGKQAGFPYVLTFSKSIQFISSTDYAIRHGRGYMLRKDLSRNARVELS